MPDDSERSSHSRRSVLKGAAALGATAVGGAALSGSAAASPGTSDVVYQYYHTDWNEIRKNLPAVADAGYDAIQVPPAQFSRLYEYERLSNAETYPQPLGYQPIDFRDFDSTFGTEDEYAAMVERAHEHGIEVIADAVVNHVAAGGDSFDREVGLDDLPQFGANDFHDPCSRQSGAVDPVEDCSLLGLRDLKHEKRYVRRQLREYLAKYAALGVDGIRFDAAKHVPEWFFRYHATEWTDELGLDAVGEVLHGSVSYCQGYADTGMSVTDFALYFTMKEDVFHPGGDMRLLADAGLVNQTPDRALTFVSNHDEEPPAYEDLAYAYVLTYEGRPRVYNHRVGIDDDEVRNLLWIRRNLLSGPASTRYVDRECYAYERGDAVVVLNRGDSERTLTVETDFRAGTTLSDCTGTVATNVAVGDSGTADLTVPPVDFAVYSPACVLDDDDPNETVTLEVSAPTGEDESVYFTGGTDSLTDWGSGIEGTESGGVWRVTVEATGEFEWKTRRGPVGATGEVWEAGANHSSTDPTPSHNGWEDGFDGAWSSPDGSGDSPVSPDLDPGTYVVRNAASGKALDVEYVAYENGANVHQWSYREGHRPQWMVQSVGDGYYRLLATHSGKAVEVEGGSTSDGANVQQWEYVGGESQQFSIEPVTEGYRLRARHSGKVLTVAGTRNGDNVEQVNEDGSQRQVWTFESP